MYRLFVVDDEAKLRHGLCTCFPWSEIGFEVVAQAENGKQALEYLKSHQVDVLLCDVKMPVLSGIEVAEELYRQRSKIKIVFFSGYRDFEFARKALEFGVKHYIVKSTKYNDMIRVFKGVKDELDQERSENSHAGFENTPDNQGYYDKIIHAIKSYVKQHYRDVELDDVARIVNMNPDYISRLFKQKSGQNFSDFLLEVKMAQAKTLLSDFRRKIYEISSMLGYNNVKNFTRAFKLFYGMNPREFRNHAGSANRTD